MDEIMTEIIFLLDRSGSMSGLERDTIGGFNSFIEMQCKLPGKTRLTTVLFDNHYEILWNGIDASEVRLTEEDYFVRGSTALLDAIGKTIVEVNQRLSKRNSTSTDQVIFVITTDGMENASREFTFEKVKEMIQEQKTHHDWKFVFMAANLDTLEEAYQIGISHDEAHYFEATQMGVKEMYETVNESVMEHRK